MYKCKYCGREFGSDQALRAHRGLKHKAELLSEPVHITSRYSDDQLDITCNELNMLKARHSKVCDICGKSETANTRPDTKSESNNLCVDHDHNTNEFRGFLCVQCNRNFGWYDKYKHAIQEHANFAHRGIKRK